jgi:hypothetical protein
MLGKFGGELYKPDWIVAKFLLVQKEKKNTRTRTIYMFMKSWMICRDFYINICFLDINIFILLLLLLYDNHRKKKLLCYNARN